MLSVGSYSKCCLLQYSAFLTLFSVCFRIGFRCVISCVGVNRCCFQAVISSIIVGQFEPDVERRTPYYSWKAEPQFLLSVFVNKWRALTACHRGEIKPLRISIMFCIITYYDGLTTNETNGERTRNLAETNSRSIISLNIYGVNVLQ